MSNGADCGEERGAEAAAAAAGGAAAGAAGADRKWRRLRGIPPQNCADLCR